MVKSYLCIDGQRLSIFSHDTLITCSTIVLQCYRRQAIPMEQAKIRPSVTLYSLDRSSPNLVWLVDYVGDPYSDANFS